ncbi:MAG: spore coat protein CotJB [Eubacteriales bacterium]
MNRTMTRQSNSYQQEMLRSIDSISLALQETVLFLDTHPYDKDALAFFDECSKMRNEALETYAKEYGPLLIDDVTMTDADYWNWINQPWPWEGGR